ncbi:hypothetical protein BSZ35_16060 [Salinibacter sp. 10B]|uniref:hypothetical protein n=1 Tax=Salinibacter sp. 10B TaxID=1923971 RepID=UPI000CF5703B|nr:hypothetical protein [Salinibacter sp. 10B]PQJ35915.1 hypothetical protein BSZ35_16060 [Salinibacter sp. 10B]
MISIPRPLPYAAALFLLAFPACTQVEQAAREAAEDVTQATDEPAPAQDVDATAVGEIGLIEAPVSVVPNSSLESDEQIYVFREHPRITLDAPLEVDGYLPNSYDGSGDLVQRRLPAGTEVRSYFLHFDPASGSSGSAVQKTGRLIFPETIVAVIAESEYLDASDGPLGHADVRYPNPGTKRAPEGSADHFSIGADRRTLRIDFKTWSVADQMRILTEAP